MKIAVHTLGCKVNQCDADALIARLSRLGHDAFSTREFNCAADVFVINTCTVTHVSDKKSRQMLRRARKMNPKALVAMCGCLAKNSPKPDGADFVFDAREPQDFLARIAPATSENGCEPPRSRTRSFIKIQDGCDRFCSYCIVPFVRGPVKSRPTAEILAEAEKLIAAGTLEIVLTGIQVAAYGHTTENLPSLIKRITALCGLRRLRLSSIDPWAVDEAFIAAVSASPALCRHFHLSLQSGCDATLSKMNRRYTAEDYRAAARSLREISPETALTTDIIVGFPGETDADFEESLAFVREMQFAQIHVFEFSERAGTAAADFPDKIPVAIKRERGKIMREAAEILRKNFLQKQIGKTASVLFEKKNSGFSENYCKVAVESSENLSNTIRKVKITACENDCLAGNLQ